MKEAYLYKKLTGKKTQCQNCAHYCVIDPSINSGSTLSKTEWVENGKRGICGVRKNINGKLYSLVYGKACAINIDPIEKKPLYHFLPGTYSLSIATVGCNFTCHACQNWQISQVSGEQFSAETSPEEIVEMAKKNKIPSISYTYTDPIVFSEYALDTMKIAKKAGLKNIWVSNGFWSKELFDLISPYLDATNIDLKSFEDEFYKKYCGARLQPVLDTLKRMKTLRRGSGQEKIWVEITTLVIPGLNDSEKMFKEIANFIKNELGPETPWHISRFFGAISWKLQSVPDTPVETLKKAEQIGKRSGLKNIHLGNV